jgi:hypothetical protein
VNVVGTHLTMQATANVICGVPILNGVMQKRKQNVYEGNAGILGGREETSVSGCANPAVENSECPCCHDDEAESDNGVSEEKEFASGSTNG